MDIKFFLPARYNPQTKQFEPEMYTNLAQNVYMGTNDNKTVFEAITEILTQTNNLSKVATSGSYNDLSNKPTIPAAYTHPSGDGNQHIPVTGTTNNGKVLTAGATAGSAAWKDPVTYSHPANHPASMITGLATVATSGKYTDLSDKPTIPAAYSHPTGDGNMHIPATGTSNNGKVLTAGSTAGSLAWKNIQELAYTQSLAANGWTKLPNGLILQWGTG